MRNSYGGALVVILFVVSLMAVGCGAGQKVQPSKQIEYANPVCFQGTVQYGHPVESSIVPFANVKVSAWRHNETKKPFAEAMADAKGKYCLEVPLGDHGVDIRVWGMVNVGSKSYTCTASQDDLKLGNTSRRCGQDCITVDLVASCSEFNPRRRLGR